MPTTYRIHPGIGIARLGNSPEAFCITPEEPAALPLDCDAQGNPLLSPDGQSERRIRTFKDARGRVKRQAARFQVYVYDDANPGGRPLRMGDPVAGGGNDGVLVDVQWRVYLANKKAGWYAFRQLEGEHGYAPDHPRRNAAITDPEARQQLLIDPGPRIVDCRDRRTARFDRDGRDLYATTFPPKLRPHDIDTLGELKTDDTGRLLVLGGHGHSGTFQYDQFGQPRIDTYANNDGWFDDISDGPVMARLVMYSERVGQVRFIDVEYPAWVIVGYPAYVPQILDMVTADDVMQDLAIRQFAERTDLYGTAGTFDHPQHVDPRDPEALALWKAGRMAWNPAYKPWFYRDIWPILFRPDEFSYLTSVLALSNYPHNQSGRGRFDPSKLSVPPMVDRNALQACERQALARHHSGDLFVETLWPALAVLEKQGQAGLGRALEAAAGPSDAPAAGALVKSLEGLLVQPAPAPPGTKLMAKRKKTIGEALGEAVGAFARAVLGKNAGTDFQAYLRRWRTAETAAPEYAKAREALEQRVEELLDAVPGRSSTRADTEKGRIAARMETPGQVDVQKVFDQLGARLRVAVFEHLRRFHTGALLEAARQQCLAACTHDPYRDYRTFLFDLLRQPGEENEFSVQGEVNSRVHGLPLMPLLAGDNPISNTLPSKFLRLTDYQYYLLRQWADGLFFNEELEGWARPDPWQPYASWVNATGRDLDRGVLSNVLGGAFCPGGEIAWVLRNPSIYREPYRVKADPAFFEFNQTAAQANANRGNVPEADYVAYMEVALSQDNDFTTGLQPGDLTKYSALPWQADFNECSMQDIDVTYQTWNDLYPGSDADARMQREQRVWSTLWWPAHRPMENYEVASFSGGQPSYRWVDWSRGVPQTNAGDLKMVTEWWRLGFILRNPYLPAGDIPASENPPVKYIGVERTEHTRTPS